MKGLIGRRPHQVRTDVGSAVATETTPFQDAGIRHEGAIGRAGGISREGPRIALLGGFDHAVSAEGRWRITADVGEAAKSAGIPVSSIQGTMIAGFTGIDYAVPAIGAGLRAIGAVNLMIVAKLGTCSI